jgi:hypothetical protein
VGKGYRVPSRCDCHKRRYRSEACARKALAEAQSSGHYGPRARVYKCPGHSCWHIATRGFHLAALKTANRVLAWYLLQYGMIDYQRMLADSFGTGLRPAGFEKARRGIIRLGLARRDEQRLGYLAAVDKAGLLRVCEVGLDEYTSEHAAGQTARPPDRV